ncbi:MAG: helix-turn-helix domain-containing protein [Nereida ignava]
MAKTVIVYDGIPAQLHAMSLKRDSLLPPEVAAAMKNEAVGHRLKMLRMAHEKSPSEMADALGIERTYWTRFEKGHQGLSDPVAALLCLRFGATLDWLILGDMSKLPFDTVEKIRAIPPEQNV